LQQGLQCVVLGREVVRLVGVGKNGEYVSQLKVDVVEVLNLVV
jgi:hypothetical protein